jgi:pimeloyl-ACP methyl ester carboxylesterase
MRSDVINRASLVLGTHYEEPKGRWEISITRVFAEVFGLDYVGAADDFFDLGGDSLLAEVVSMRIGELTGQDFRPSWLVESSCPREIAKVIDAQPTKTLPTPQVENYRPPIFVVHGRGGFTLPEPSFFQALAKGQKLRMFELPGIRDGRCHERVEDIAADYVAQLTREYPDGPILLGAFCAGGLIALEMAAQLLERGRPICQLVLLDPPIRDGTLSVGRIGGSERRPGDSLLKAKLRGLVPMGLLHRYHELKYRAILLRKRGVRAVRPADLGFSIKAQAKLYVSFFLYQPRPYYGPVTVLSSYGRSRSFRGGTRLSDLMPQTIVHLVSERHSAISGSAAAAGLMQAEFDAAIRRTKGPAQEQVEQEGQA